MNTLELAHLYGKMFLIRAFEERLLELFSQGLLNGTTHTYIGQEAAAVGCISNLSDNDTVFSNHRCHGHYLARFDDPEGLLAEIMGRTLGVCGGRGGSQHLARERFYSSGIQGGFLPIATGIALREKLRGGNSIVVAFIGDGTLGQGVVYESFNMMALWSVPVLVVIENNGYAQSTAVESNLAGSIVGRAKAFGIDSAEISSNDVGELSGVFRDAVKFVRDNKKPFVQVIHTYRLGPHSKGDDFRPVAEINAWRSRCPLKLAEARLDRRVTDPIREAVLLRLASVERKVIESPLADWEA